MAATAIAATSSTPAPVPLGCTGSASLGTFELMVRPFTTGAALPLKSVAAITAGSRLIWNPVHFPPKTSADGEVAPVLVPVSEDDKLLVLEPRKVGVPTEWQLPESPEVIALIFGPHGLSEGKIKSLVMHNRDLLRQLAAYAEQSSEVETLVQELANAEQTGASPDAVLQGFGTKYGVSMPTLDGKAPSSQNASVLLGALVPAAGNYDPLATQSAQVAQTAGLAASVAGMFFGSPIGLAAGGTALLANLKTTIFPSTEFRSAFAQSSGHDGLALCTKTATPKAKTRLAFLWAYRVPAVKMPKVSLTGSTHLPLGAKSTVTVKIASGSAPKDMELARLWHLTPAAGGAAIAVDVAVGKTPDTLDIDLTKAKLAAGDYQLGATWDWGSMAVEGTLHLHPFGDFSKAHWAHGARDRLVEGSGEVAARLEGTDFEFLDKAEVEPAGVRNPKPVVATFVLPTGLREGPQNTVDVDIDTAKRGNYRLLLAQSNGSKRDVPLTVLPPNPEISNLPVRVNVGETRQVVRLEGTGLNRVEGVSCAVGTIAGGPDERGWAGEITLKARLERGKRFSLLLKIKGMDDPLPIPDAVEVVGPRPRILSVQQALVGDSGTALAAGELPVGVTAGLVLRVENLRPAGDDAHQPRVELDCESGELRQALRLSPGESSHGASLAFAGPGALYLSVDPGAVGYAGCNLAARVVVEPAGRSNAFVLGRVVRVPRLETFTLTTEKIGDSSYAGILQGKDLDVIEKAGWDPQNGVPVDSIPAPMPSDPTRQKLRVVLPWPAPAPHAPLYIWLRGETSGRKTSVTY